MSVFSRVLIPTLCAVAALAPLSARAQELPRIFSVQQLPMPPGAVRPVQTAHFGEQVFTDGVTTLVTVDDGPYAYTYNKNTSGQWKYQAALPALPGTVVTGPGALRGNVALVQTAGRFDSSVLVFLRANGQWRHTQTLPSPDLRSFGRVNNLTIGPNYIAIGNPLESGFAGAVYAYKQEAPGIYGGDFGAPQRLDISDARGFAPHSNLWGFNPIGIGDTLMVAELLGAVYEFTRNSSGFWSYRSRFARTDGTITTDRFAFASGNLVMDWQDPPFIDVFFPNALVRVNGVWTSAGDILHPSEQRGLIRTPQAVYGRRLVIDNRLWLYERNTFQGRTGWSARAQLVALGCGFDEGGPAKYEARPFTVAMLDTLAFVACPGAQTAGTPFEGNVLVFTLPPLLNPNANL
jgi:hypothetical protein